MRHLKTALIVAVFALAICDVSASQTMDTQNAAPTDLIPTTDWVEHTAFTLNWPLREVWPVFKDIRRWYTEYSLEVLSGPAYQARSGLVEGQVLKVTSAEGFARASEDNSQPHFFVMKTIKVIPQKEIIIVLWGGAFDFKQYASVYIWKLKNGGAKTTISIDSYGAADLVKPLSNAELNKYRADITQGFHRSWAKAFVNLEKVITSEHTHH